MPDFDGEEGIVLGIANDTVVYIQDDTGEWHEMEGVEYYKVETRINQMSKFTIEMPQIEDTEKVYVKEFAKVAIFTNLTLVLKGRIQKVTYETAYAATIEGFGMEATILDKEYKNSTRSPDDPDRVQYENISAQLIAQELLSTNADGTTPWTMEPRIAGLYDTDYGQVSMRYEYANKLTALAKLAEIINYEWWVDQDALTYADFFNIASLKGNQTDPSTDANRQFTITGDDANSEGTDYQKDVTNVANYVKITGYGDGMNQAFTSTYNASPIYSLLAENIDETETDILLVDASAFPSPTGEIRIAEERITYTGVAGNYLTGCVRGTSGTTAKAHRKSCYLEKYVAYASPEEDSSLSDNGLMELTLTYRDVRDVSTLELIASKELLDRMNPIERITVIPTSPEDVAETLETGDLISVIDAESSLNSNYRVVGIIYENNYGVLSISLEASNKSLTFIEQMQKEREANQNLQKYMQGATNIYAINCAENCDAGTPLSMRFFIPSDVIAINRVTLNYKIKPFRVYNLGGETSVNTEVSRVAGSGSLNSSVALNSNTWTTMQSLTTSNNDCEGCFLNFGASCVSIANGSSGSGDVLWRITEGANTYPNTSGVDMFTGDYMWRTSNPNSGSIAFYIPGNQKNKTFNLQFCWSGYSNSVTWVWNISGSYTLYSRHTHDYSFGIYEQPLTDPGVQVFVGEDGVSESPVGVTSLKMADVTNMVPGTMYVGADCDNEIFITTVGGATELGEIFLIDGSFADISNVASQQVAIVMVPNDAWQIEGGDYMTVTADGNNTNIYFPATTDSGDYVWYPSTDGSLWLDSALTDLVYAAPSATEVEVDITDEVQAVGVGKWINIQFTPNQPLRIEADAYIQVFIESK